MHRVDSVAICHKHGAMTPTRQDKKNTKTRTIKMKNKSLTPTGDNQHPKITNEQEFSRPSTSPLRPLMMNTKTTGVETNQQKIEMEQKEQTAQGDKIEEAENSLCTKILHDADLMSSLCSCSYALTNYYPPRMVALACLLLTVRHHCYHHLQSISRSSNMDETSQSISTEIVRELLQNIFHFNEEDSSTSVRHAAANLFQRLKLLPHHYLSCHTVEEEKDNDNHDSTNALVIIANVMGEIEQFLCTNLPSPTQLPSTASGATASTVFPPTNSSLSVTSVKQSAILSDITGMPHRGMLNTSSPPTSPPKLNSSKISHQRRTPTPPTSPRTNLPPTVTTSPQFQTVACTTSTPTKARQPLKGKDNCNNEDQVLITPTSSSRRRLHQISVNEADNVMTIHEEFMIHEDKENNDSAIGMNLDVTGNTTSSKSPNGSCGDTNFNSSPSSHSSSKTSSPDSGTSTVSHTKGSMPEIDTIKKDFDLQDIDSALSDVMVSQKPQPK